MTLERLRLPADARFWPAPDGPYVTSRPVGAPERRLESIHWLVPGGSHAVLARAALRNALGGAAFTPRALHLWAPGSDGE